MKTIDLSDRVIKTIAEKDLTDCLYVIHKSFATVAQEFGLTEENCSKHTSFMKMERLRAVFESKCPMFGYFVGTELVGYVSLSKKDDVAYEIHNLAVLPEYRHSGIGSALIEHCKTVARHLGGKKITLGIIEENTKLKNWYIKNGFVHTGTMLFPHLPFTVGFMETEV
ncbi:MAG: GNAT family N-acetyltransferase [Firmicutes bacterium HGW-Firmicutes-21]|nr:MAG: GNAT family N-acetyltransferase [Firmicutes bacterium HGW-Firmicutes-21]